MAYRSLRATLRAATVATTGEGGGKRRACGMTSRPWCLAHQVRHILSYPRRTRSTGLRGTAFLWLDCRTPVAAVRAELERICRSHRCRTAGSAWPGWARRAGRSCRSCRCGRSRAPATPAMPSTCAASLRGRMIGFLARGHAAALPRPPRGGARGHPFTGCGGWCAGV